MAITRAQQYRQMLEDGGMLVQPSTTGRRPGYRMSNIDRGFSAPTKQGQSPRGSTTSSSSNKKDDPSPQEDAREAYIRDYVSKQKVKGGGKKKPGTSGKDPKDYRDSTPEQLSAAAKRQQAKYRRQFTRQGKAAPGMFNTNTLRGRIDKRNYERRLQEMQRKAFEKYQRLDDLGLVSLVDDLGATGEDLTKGSGFTLNEDGTYSYNPDFFRDETGAFKKEFIDQSGNLQIPGYDFSNIAKFGKPSRVINEGTSLEKVIPNINDLQNKTGIASFDILGQLLNPDTQVGAFNLLSDARQIQDFASRFGTGDESAFDEYKAFMDERGPPKPRDDPSGQSDPCLGPNPPAYCFIGKKADQTAQNAIARNLGGLSPRIGGSIFDFTGMAEGGIVDMAREEMFLGGIVKGIKKGLKGATRAIKKVAKSPIGKAVLLGAGLGFAGIGPFKGLAGTKLGTGLSSLFKGKASGILEFVKDNPMLAIGGASLLAGAMTPKEEDEFDVEAYYAANRLNPNPDLFPRILGTQFAAADGGRIGYADAGGVISEKEMKKIAKSPLYKGFKKMYGIDPSMAKDNPAYDEKFDTFEKLYKEGFQKGGDVEPVAKKTMPLLDMGGQEMDLRDEGGFVPIGRMEKADDVPARLSKNEFVFTADAVRNAGDGDVDKGAEVMYNMMKNLEAGGEVSEESQGLEGARKMFQTSQRLEEVL